VIIVKDEISLSDIKKMSSLFLNDMVKGVVDIENEILALDSELHSDLEARLIENGSLQKNLWGINLYPYEDENDFLEFDSVINIRPSDNNRSRYVEDENKRNRIRKIVARLIKK